MSPVLDITITNLDGPAIRCVLKLYDRWFGTSLRASYGEDPVPHTLASEAAFLGFVRRGMMPEFIGYLNEANALVDQLPPVPRQFLDGTTKGQAKYEAALWRECNEHFRSETQAYMRLASHRGKSVPRMLGHVRLAADGQISSSRADIPPQAASYFEVRGVLLELLDRYNLEDITTSPLAPLADDMAKWQQIIQSAVDLAHEINELGIIIEDCAPRNVFVDRRSQTPYMVDLAQCLFPDELVVQWHTWDLQEEEGWDQDV
ncbi:hypothetical protein C8A05DRAFT_37230 [Staphylotrichum tortipilum]|uniref:Protein kinase domain-containing protein n=1 Tax=Staphylotrichum tortipilum TaxID=2831512 RepID=A0AAN6ME86_9PEZI|nr:hypothetical protein C8A05DRAFT_37230 [Staphylotrichum longicolle]